MFNLKAQSKRYYLSPFTASTPAMRSLCPAINFVAECITISKREKGQLKNRTLEGEI